MSLNDLMDAARLLKSACARGLDLCDFHEIYTASFIKKIYGRQILSGFHSGDVLIKLRLYSFSRCWEVRTA